MQSVSGQHPLYQRSAVGWDGVKRNPSFKYHQKPKTLENAGITLCVRRETGKE